MLLRLPADYDPRHYSRAYLNVSDGSKGIRIFDPVADSDDYQLEDGDRAMWIELVDGGDGTRYQPHTQR